MHEFPFQILQQVRLDLGILAAKFSHYSHSDGD